MVMNLDQQILDKLNLLDARLRDVLAREATIITMLQQVKSQVDRLVADSEPPSVSITSSI